MVLFTKISPIKFFVDGKLPEEVANEIIHLYHLAKNESSYNREYRGNSEIFVTSIREECLDTDMM